MKGFYYMRYRFWNRKGKRPAEVHIYGIDYPGAYSAYRLKPGELMSVKISRDADVTIIPPWGRRAKAIRLGPDANVKPESR